MQKGPHEGPFIFMVLSTAYFPTCAWLDAVAQGAQIEAHEHFQKQTLRNRCTILTAGGTMKLIVPYVHNGGQKMLIRDVRIDYATPWQRTHRRAIEAAYRSSPFWEHFEGKIVPLFEGNDTFLWDLNARIAQQLFEALKIKATLTPTDHFVGAQEPQSVEQPYIQVFADRLPFTAGLSALDSIFCQARLSNAE